MTPAALTTELKAMREAAGLSQTELARRIGAQPSTVSRIESGTREPGLETLDAWARACGKTLLLQFRENVTEIDVALAALAPGLSRLDDEDRAYVRLFVSVMGNPAITEREKEMVRVQIDTLMEVQHTAWERRHELTLRYIDLVQKHSEIQQQLDAWEERGVPAAERERHQQAIREHGEVVQMIHQINQQMKKA